MYDEDPYQVCPECGGEFELRYSVVTCVDCEVPLVRPEEIAARNARELPLSPALTRLCTAPIPWARTLAADLAYAGIPYAVDRREARAEGVLSIHVRPVDRAAARSAEAARRRTDPIPGEDDLPLPVETQTRDSTPDFKVCPECGGEFRRDVERCADCGVGLVEPSEAEEEESEEEGEIPAEEVEVRTEFPAPPLHQIPASDDLVCYYCGPFRVLAGLSAAFDAAAIGHRIERGPYERSKAQACLYLEAKDCAMADRVAESPEASREEAAAERECPACGGALPAGAKECGGCGLQFGSPEVQCRRCGAILMVGWRGCPNCGTRLDAS